MKFDEFISTLSQVEGLIWDLNDETLLESSEHLISIIGNNDYYMRYCKSTIKKSFCTRFTRQKLYYKLVELLSNTFQNHFNGFSKKLEQYQKDYKEEPIPLTPNQSICLPILNNFAAIGDATKFFHMISLNLCQPTDSTLEKAILGGNADIVDYINELFTIKFELNDLLKLSIKYHQNHIATSYLKPSSFKTDFDFLFNNNNIQF